MIAFAYFILFGWPLLVIVMFAIWPARRAASVALIGAWLYLPPYALPIAGLPDYTKITAAVIGIVIGTLLFHPDRLLKFRPRWFDLPMAAWCLCDIPSYSLNGLTLHDMLSATLGQIILWGIPYLMGRVHFSTPEDLRYFGVAMVVGGLSYVLPCAEEMRMSPNLMRLVYGGETGSSDMMRLGGYRPVVFFGRGLECAMWMTAASLTGWWLWHSGTLRRIGPYPFGPLLLILIVTTILGRSSGALMLLAVGIAGLWLSSRLRSRLLLAGLLLIGPVYAGLRAPNLWSGQQAVDLAESLFGPKRAESLKYRFRCERLLAAHALERPGFGWGGYGRHRVFFDEERTQAVATDGLWIIALGSRGLVGLVVNYLILGLPAWLFLWRFPAHRWTDPRVAMGTLAAALLGLYIMDCLLNAFINIIYITLAGGLIGLDPRQVRGPAAPSRTEAARPTPPACRPAVSAQLLQADRCRALGRSARRQGHPEEADAAWRRALELLADRIAADPDADTPRRDWCDCANDLAWLWANHPDASRRDPAAAVSLARRAVDEYPDAATYWNTLGAACFRAGDDRGAIAALERSASLGGGTAFDDVFLAMALARIGDAEGARRAMARALVRAERDHPGHHELAALCDEAHALIDGGTTAPAVV